MENKEQGKKDFILGIAIGVAAVSFVGFIFMASGMSFNKSDDNSDKNVKADNVASDTSKNINIVMPAASNVKGQKVGDDWVRGNPEAKITLLEYSDIQCPYCQRYHDTLKEVMKAYPNDVKWVYKHFPLDSIHPFARKAAEATECAGDQDEAKFWEMMDVLYANQKILSNDLFSQVADKLDLDTKEFDQCLSSGKFAKVVSDNLAEGQVKGVRGTPGSFINGTEVKGAQPFESLKAMIDIELAK